jgi:glyoxylase-like metal-dependent hydrolase (beta-lactamase superfamily II)
MNDRIIGKGRSSTDRREFLRLSTTGTFGGIALSTLGNPASQAAAATPANPLQVVSDHLAIYRGAVNTGIVTDGDRALLIDCGDPGISASLTSLGVKQTERLLITHYHRDQVCEAHAFLKAGCRLGVPEEEALLFSDPTTFWNNDAHLWRVYESFRPNHLVPIDPFPVGDTYQGGDQFSFGPASIRVLATPGHTDGSLSYLVEVDGWRVVFSGDCISGPGQLLDLFSLQRGFQRGNRKIGGYHGFMGDRWRLAESLRKLADLEPNLLVPSHGKPMDHPRKSIDLLIERLDGAYENYVSISALRHYFPELFTAYSGKPGQMPLREGFSAPECLTHMGTTWMLRSRSGAVLVMDVGTRELVRQIKETIDRDGGTIEGLWITHYHFDHTDGVPAFQQEFDCPCFTDRRLADVLTNPSAWRLPCLAPEPIRVDRPLEDGAFWNWHEFKLTSYSFPGQTLYHAALLVEGEGLRVLFVGDSHTRAGLDDYCAYNRNWLGRGVGFQYCLDLVEQLQPTHLFNCHVDQAFTFTGDEIRLMREKLDQRERLFGEMVPWDHANYGTDPSWVRCSPYLQSARPGIRVKANVVITNHSPEPRFARCRAVLPESLGGQRTEWASRSIPSRTEGELAIEFSISSDAHPGRYPVAVDVEMGERSLPQIAETLITVE